MIKKKSFTLQAQDKKSGGWAKFQEWNRKWNKIMSLVFCVLIFALLFAIVVVNTTSESANKDNRLGQLAGPCALITITDADNTMCDVLCNLSKNLTADVEAAIGEDLICSLLGYHLRFNYPNIPKLSTGWFKTNKLINKITIRDNASLIEIEPGAFNNCHFRKLTELVLRRTGITVLRNGVFDGINSLLSLTLAENNFMELIEEQALNPLYQLEELKIIQHTQILNLMNITGKTQFHHLHTLTLNNNNFGSTIDNKTFAGCIRVEILNLFNSSIETIGIGSFDPMKETIRFLDLRRNQLSRLPSNLLGNFHNPDMELFLSNNSWHCDCDALELQWYDRYSSIITDAPLICEMPHRDVEIRNVNLDECNTTSTPPEPNTSVSPISTTTTPAPILERLKCADDKYTSNYVYMERAYQKFYIKQFGIGKVLVETNYSDPDLSIVLLNSHGESECRYDVKTQMYFDGLSTNSTHIFCVMKKSSYATSPNNCIPFHFTETKSIWGHDEIIIALVCSIVLSLVVGLLIGWLLSCRYHRVFKTKEALQYKSSGSSSGKTITEDFNSSIASDYHGLKFSSDRGSNLRRTYSDNSIISCKSYITAVTPSPFEIIQWKLRKNALNSNDYYVRDYLDKLEYDCLPPPLPPHPNRRHTEKIYETIGEPIYTCTSEIVPYKITYASSILKDINN